MLSLMFDLQFLKKCMYAIINVSLELFCLQQKWEIHKLSSF